MKKILVLSGAIAIIIVSLFQLVSLRIIPSTQIWDKYNILYIDIKADVQQINTLLTEHGIVDALSINHNNFPPVTLFSPITLETESTEFSYSQLQTLFFFDKEQSYNLFYIPEEHVSNVHKALDSIDYIWGIDTQASIPAIPFIVSLLFSLFLFLNSKNKVYFFTILSPYILFSLTSPFYHISASVCLLSYAIFRIQKYWHRDFFVEKLKQDIFLIISIVFAFIGSLLLGVRGVLLFFLSSLASISALFVIYSIKSALIENSFFKPTYIYTAKTIPINRVLKIKYALIPLLAIVFLTIISSLNIQPQEKNTSKALHIPAPSGYTVTDSFSAENYVKTIHINADYRLPDLSDYINAAWNIETYPYKKIGDVSSDFVLPGEIVSFTNYESNGFRLEEVIETVATFDDEYIKKVVDSALSSTSNGAEKLLASQKGFSRVQYATSASIKTSFGALIFLICNCIYMTYALICLRFKRQELYERKKTRL